MTDRALLAAVILTLLPSLAFAEGGVVLQSGRITPGRVPVWETNGVVKDGGPALNGKVTGLGITNTGTPFCINDAPITSLSGYHQLCLGADDNNTGIISLNAIGGATPLPLTVDINGADFTLPITFPIGAASVIPSGLVGDGTTDNCSVLSAYIASVGVGHPVVISLGPGTYLTSCSNFSTQRRTVL